LTFGTSARTIDVLIVRDEFLLLLAGFGLTTVAGGLLGSWLQARAWRRQESERLQQLQLEAARVFYEELSRLLDRRLHRMRQLDGWLERRDQGAEIDRMLVRYREVLDEWNDNLNRNLALAIRYFGNRTHAVLEDLYEKFNAAGSRIESRVREYRNDGKRSPPVTTDLRKLDLVIYDLNLEMIEALQRGSIGAPGEE
jgi:hypothetical protein